MTESPRRTYLRAAVLHHLENLSYAEPNRDTFAVLPAAIKTALEDSEVAAIPSISVDEISELLSGLKDLGVVQLVEIPKVKPRCIVKRQDLQSYLWGLRESDEPFRNIGLFGDELLAEILEEHPFSASEQPNISELVPASDRYVSSSHNSETFAHVDRTLDDIKAEFAKDHNKGELKPFEPLVTEAAAEIEATQAQIKFGFVRVSILVYLAKKLKQLSERAKDFNALHTLLITAYDALIALIKFIS